MSVEAKPVRFEEILALRSDFLDEIAAQVRYDACHVRGWSDSYLLCVDERAVGYGSVKGKDDLSARDAIFEWYVEPPLRGRSVDLFESLLDASGARFIECQTNEPGLLAMLHRFTADPAPQAVLFKDGMTTQHPLRACRLRRRTPDDPAEGGEGDYVLVAGNEIVGAGGFLLHYNPPFADVHMSVIERFRRRGFGTLLVQELKRACYEADRVPAARCRVDNEASKATLQKAGFAVAGHMLTGEVTTS